MVQEKYTVLVIDDEEPIRRLLEKELSDQNREVYSADSKKQAMEYIAQQYFSVIIMDLRLPDVSDLELMVQLKESLPLTEIIMITGHGDVDTAVEAMKLGAYDFISKPFNLERLDLLVAKANQSVMLKRENAILRQQAGDEEESVDFIGKSKGINEIMFLVNKVAPAKIPVLITGESGAGKDVIARLIHMRSGCSGKPMIVKNCASLQKELARSELFGHVKGSFTGADDTRDGLLAFAHESTLFLDEIGELPLEVQASLLRALETQTYRRVGEKEERKVNIRFLFATNRHLAEEVEKGRFNEAFYHRINAFTIKVPRLAERKEDLPLLVDYFLTTLSSDGSQYKMVESAMACLMGYDWPGNVRELRNVLERSMILAENGLITERCLPRELVERAEDGSEVFTLETVEKQHILKMLDLFEGNRQKTAETLGISRKTLYRKLLNYTAE